MIIFSPLDKTLALLVYYGTKSGLLFSVLLITEMIILKVLFIFKFSTLAAMNEYFLKNMIIMFNIVVITIHFIIRTTLNEHQTSSHSFDILRGHLHLLSVRTEAQDNVVR